MITLTQFQDILSDTLFGGNSDVAGIVIFCVLLALIFTVLRNNLFASLVLAIPTAFVCSILGLLSADLLMILIVVCIIGLVAVGKRTIGE